MILDAMTPMPFQCDILCVVYSINANYDAKCGWIKQAYCPGTKIDSNRFFCEFIKIEYFIINSWIQLLMNNSLMLMIVYSIATQSAVPKLVCKTGMLNNDR